jgi:Domain of Unknown Function with PDB structure (DUF3857)/Transglutaminase-like superfamily
MDPKLRSAISAIVSGVAIVIGSAAYAAQPDAPATRVKHLTADIHVAPDGTSVQTAHAEVLATNAAAAIQAGQFRVLYDSALQTLDVIEAHTLKKDGRTITVDPTAVYDQLAPGAAQMPMFSELRMKTVVFPQFEAGDTAVYTVKTTYKEPYFPGVFWYLDVYSTAVAFDDVQETVTAPTSLHVKAESHDVPVDEHNSGDQTVISWHYSAPAPKEPELSAVVQLESTPHVFLSSFRDYAALGRAYAEAAAPKMAVTEQVQALADDVTKGVTSKREQARKLYEWVSLHIRYVAVELGRGSLVPHDAQAVLSNGYGDCKDHVTLLGALLKAKGIASEAVLINSGSDYSLTGVPTFADLDHIITYLPEFDLYLDSTAIGAPFAVLPFEEYGKPVVFASVSKPRRADMPLLPAGVATATLKTDLTLDEEGTLTGTTVTTAKGPYAILLRFVGLGVQAVGPQTAAQRVLAAYGPDATGTIDAVNPTSTDPSYTITGRFAAHGWKDKLDGQYSFYMPGGMRLLGILGDGMVGAFGDDSQGPGGERPCYNVSTTEEQTLHAPDQAKLAHFPQDTHVETKYLTFDALWTRNGSTLSVRRTFTTHVDHALCTAEVRKANEAALKDIGDSYNASIWFQKPPVVPPALPKVQVPKLEVPRIAVPTEPPNPSK